MGKFSYFYTFNTFIFILINIKLILMLSRFDLDPTLKTLNLSLLRFFERSGSENHGYYMSIIPYGVISHTHYICCMVQWTWNHVSDPSSSTSTLDIAIVPSLQARSTSLVRAPSVQAPNPEVQSSKLQIDRVSHHPPSACRGAIRN